MFDVRKDLKQYYVLLSVSAPGKEVLLLCARFDKFVHCMEM